MTGDPVDVNPEFWDFFRRNFPRGKALARNLGLDHGDAEEATTDAMAAMHDRWDDSTIKAPEAFFFRVVRNKAVDLAKARNKRLGPLNPHLEVEDCPEPDSGPLEVGLDPLQAILAKEQLRELLSRLPMSQRVSLYLFVEGYSRADRAEIKNIPENTEKSHFQRAKRKMLAVIMSDFPELVPKHTTQSVKEESGE